MSHSTKKLTRRHTFQVLPVHHRIANDIIEEEDRPPLPTDRLFIRSSSANSAWEHALPRHNSRRSSSDMEFLENISSSLMTQQQQQQLQQLQQQRRNKNKRKLSFQGLKQFSLNFLESRKNKKAAGKGSSSGCPTPPKTITRHYSMDNIMPNGGKHPGFNKRNSLVIHHASHVDLSTMDELDEVNFNYHHNRGDRSPRLSQLRSRSHDADACDSIGSSNVGTTTSGGVDDALDRVDSAASSFGSGGGGGASDRRNHNFFIGEGDEPLWRQSDTDDTCTSLESTAERRRRLEDDVGGVTTSSAMVVNRTKVPTGTNLLDNFMWKDVIIYDETLRHSGSSNSIRSSSGGGGGGGHVESDSDTVNWQFSEHLPSLDSGISIPPPFTHDVTFTYMNHDPMFVKDSLAPILDSPESDSEVRMRARTQV